MILDKARELGIALSESEEFLRMRQARALLDADSKITDTLMQFQDKQNELVTQLSGENPDQLLVASLSHDVELLQTQLLEIPLFAEAIEAQNAFQLLMSEVNKEIGACIGIETKESGGECGGSCDGCAGCSH